MEKINKRIYDIENQIKELVIAVKQLNSRKAPMQKNIPYSKYVIKNKELCEKAEKDLKYLEVYVELYLGEINKLKRQLTELKSRMELSEVEYGE